MGYYCQDEVITRLRFQLEEVPSPSVGLLTPGESQLPHGEAALWKGPHGQGPKPTNNHGELEEDLLNASSSWDHSCGQQFDCSLMRDLGPESEPRKLWGNKCFVYSCLVCYIAIDNADSGFSGHYNTTFSSSGDLNKKNARVQQQNYETDFNIRNYILSFYNSLEGTIYITALTLSMLKLEQL